MMLNECILITFASIAAAFVIGKVLIPVLQKIGTGKVIYQKGPDHFSKAGTPQMGGFIFIIPALIFALVFIFTSQMSEELGFCLISAFGFGAIGFADDYLKIHRRSWEGLNQEQKLIFQLIFSFVLTLWAITSDAIQTSLILPFSLGEWDLGQYYIPVTAFLIIGMTSSTNFLDGLDGLLGGCSIPVFATQAVLIAMLSKMGMIGEMRSVVLLCCTLVGGITGFMFFNIHPAKVFMGDVGSFFIGGAMLGIAIISRSMLFYLIMALCIVATGLSDVVQVSYSRLTNGKRILKMAPLHHHFEKLGVPETKITAFYVIITCICSLVSLLMFV